jgi:hypothetical protein
MTALIAILSATAVCYATFAASDASDAEFAGMTASISAQEAQLSNQLAAYEHSRIFATYRQYYDLYSLFSDEASKADASSAEALRRQMREIGGVIAILWHDFLPQKYIKPDYSGYDVERELDAQLAEAALSQDLDPAPHFAEADALRKRTWFLTADTIIFGLAFWFFTMGRIIENRLKYLMAFVGIILMLIGVLEIAFSVFERALSVFGR